MDYLGTSAEFRAVRGTDKVRAFSMLGGGRFRPLRCRIVFITVAAANGGRHRI